MAELGWKDWEGIRLLGETCASQVEGLFLSSEVWEDSWFDCCLNELLVWKQIESQPLVQD